MQSVISDYTHTVPKILFVDDEEINLRAFVRALRRQFEVITANSGSAALDILETEPDVHIIISDQKMPEMTGIELLKKAMEKKPEIIRIILTGYTEEDDIRKAVNDCGIFRYLTKPWNDEELKSVLSQAEETFRLRSDNRRLIEELKSHNAELEEKVRLRTNAIEDQKESISLQNQMLEQALSEVENAIKELEKAVVALERKNEELNEAHLRIKDSITYAKNIQQAILPHTEDFYKYFTAFEHIFWAKDVVSGDFYWAKKTPTAFYFALGDCTGHGVPGAFMTVMAITLLNQIVRSENEPTCDAALDQLHEHICIALKQEFGENRDGLDIALCKITEKEGSFFLQYAGAHRPLFFTKAGKLHSFAANRFSVGGKTKQIRCYEAHEIVLEKKSRIYAFTDGLPHLPNVEREKFGLKKIMNILESYLDVSLQDQKDSLEKALILHSENLVDIRDDVSFIALEL